MTAAIIASLSILSVASAHTIQTSYAVTLNWFSLLVTYPSEVLPGDVFNVSIQGTPRSAGPVYVQNLTVTIYYVDAAGLHQIVSQTLVGNPANSYGYYGMSPTGSFTKIFMVTVPRPNSWHFNPSIECFNI